MTIVWQPPGGGMWQLESLHVNGPQPRIFQERGPEAFKLGFQSSSRRYGLPIDYLDMGFVNDHCYARMRVVGAPDPKPGKASSPPPDFVLKLMSRLHPEYRRRAKTARAALAEQRWHADAAWWYDELRPEMLEADRGLQAEPVAALSDDELVDHLRRAADLLVRGFTLHFELVLAHDVPLGRLVLGCREWGIDDAAALALLAGSSPSSAGSVVQLQRIAAACDAAGVVPSSLDDVRGASDEARAELDAYLADHAWRMITNYTPRGLALIEMPDVVVEAIRAARSREAVRVPDAAALRAQVPESDRARFDDLLADARACYGVRDDNVALTIMWPSGLVRRALLEIADRLVTRGVLRERDDALALGEAELAAALRGDVSLGEVARERTLHGEAAAAAGAPGFLGDSEGDPPDTSLFPAAMAELTGAVMALFDLDGFGEDTSTAAWSGEGVGIGSTSYTGRACVAETPEDALMKLEPGDVLVTSRTTPAFEAVMAIAGAVVTNVGGLLSHTAMVCREHGIPAVLGVAGATVTIVDGSRVVVDPSAGQVTMSAEVPA